MNFLQHPDYKNAYLGKRAFDFVHVSSGQMRPVYAAYDITIPTELSSLLQYISESDGHSLTEIARAFHAPHQVTAKRLNKLLDFDFIVKIPDAHDRRRSAYFLTEAGEEEAEKLKACMRATAKIYEKLYEEIDVHLVDALESAIKSLQKTPIIERFEQENKK